MIQLLRRTLAGCLLLVAGGCSNSGPQPEEARNRVPQQTTREVIAAHAPEILAIPGVTGMMEGVVDGKECIRILVAEETEEITASLPKTLGGYPVVIYESGEIGLHGESPQ